MDKGSEPRRVFITGASGYLGQFLVDQVLKSEWANGKVELSGTYQGRREGIPDGVTAYRLSLEEDSEEQIEAVLRAARPDVVINLAAISSPADCEKRPETAMAANCPLALLSALSKVSPGALWVQLSTDQIFCGDAAPYTTASDAKPKNAYGRSKLAFERALAAQWPRHVTLRSSLIVGPPPPRPCARQGTFLQFLDSALAAPGAPVKLFHDEVRSVLGVGDVVRVLCSLLQAEAAELCGPEGRQLNMGGPDGLSRVQMGLAVARERGYDGPARVAEVARAALDLGFVSPLDISMDSTELWTAAWLPGGPPAAFTAVVRDVLGDSKPLA